MGSGIRQLVLAESILPPHNSTCGKLHAIMDQRARYFLPFAILIAILAVSTASIFIRFAQNDGVPSFVIAALRLTFATAILAPIALSKHREELKRLTLNEILLVRFLGHFPRLALCHMDIVSRIYQRGKFGGIREHRSALGGVALAAVIEGTSRADSHHRVGTGTRRRDNYRVV